MSDLGRVTARLIASGHQGLLQRLLDNILPEEEEIRFGSIKVAKALMRDLYKWMTYHPEVKARTSLKLNEATVTLYIKPRGISEKRGRSR